MPLSCIQQPKIAPGVYFKRFFVCLTSHKELLSCPKMTIVASKGQNTQIADNTRGKKTAQVTLNHCASTIKWHNFTSMHHIPASNPKVLKYKSKKRENRFCPLFVTLYFPLKYKLFCFSAHITSCHPSSITQTEASYTLSIWVFFFLLVPVLYNKKVYLFQRTALYLEFILLQL